MICEDRSSGRHKENDHILSNLLRTNIPGDIIRCAFGRYTDAGKASLPEPYPTFADDANHVDRVSYRCAQIDRQASNSYSESVNQYRSFGKNAKKQKSSNPK
ncbi:MAG: hypothetical protein IPQ18_14640 [Saprospiraceae bacterium]|nr:hypothetical protein [Saprospiraceae bacterium]